MESKRYQKAIDAAALLIENERLKALLNEQDEVIAIMTKEIELLIVTSQMLNGTYKNSWALVGDDNESDVAYD